MLSEKFDKKIKASLEQHSAGYDEKAWDKMSRLLDKYLPQNKSGRRRIILFFLLFLLLGGGAFVLINQYAGSGSSEKIIATKTQPVSQPSVEVIKQGSTKETEMSIPATENENRAPVLNSQAGQEPLPAENKKILAGKTYQPGAVSLLPVDRTGKKKKEVIKQDKTVLPGIKNTVPPGIMAPEKADEENEPVIPAGDAEKKETINVEKETELQNPFTDSTVPVQQEIKKQETTVSPVIKPKKQTAKKTFFSNFFISVSAGPDVSTVGIEKTGKLKPVLGAGIGYSLSPRFAVRTGFYAGRKVYTAMPDEYNPPSNFWNYYPNLKHIDADCRVYEIPVMVDFAISHKKKESWFVSAGLSSLLMKKEDYSYYFKPAYSATYVYYNRSFENENKHYFSVLNLSGGYSRKISSGFSVQAEPYMKIALSGVGYGKVKLNSAGILFSAVLHSFRPKNK
jgi:hypothetical protein